MEVLFFQMEILFFRRQYIELILEEFQKFGGNSILNIFRGGGVYIMKFYAMLQKNLM